VVVSVPVGAANKVPGTATVNVGAADASTGAVTGSVAASDPDGDALMFSGSTATAKGSLVVNSDGTFSYLPTPAARHAASAVGASASAKSDDFTITMSDDHGATVTIPVTVTVSPKNAVPVVSTPIMGSPDGSTGAIAGTIVAVDADGDTLAYTGSTTTSKGTVTVSPVGTFTYTPTASARYAAGSTSATAADKTDSFTVTIVDGYGATLTVPVSVSISPLLARISFNFVYGSGSEMWTADARSALQSAADILASYITVANPVTITYNVIGTSTGGSQLANASTSFASGRDGFYGTVVQNKILTGVDSNGSSADGTITWNFGQPWSFGSTVGRNQYDATAVALHEVLHTFGFLTGIGSPSNMDRNWTTYDSFLVASDGTAVVGTDFVYKSAYTANLTGGNGGLYFGGPNAVAAYGGLVPVYTPSTWSAGSSVSHLNPTNKNANIQVMNPFESTGLGDRVLSPVEIGILKDLGYTVNSGTPISAFVIVGFGIMLFRRNRRD
jgi:VCBS repeat-containing protein